MQEERRRARALVVFSARSKGSSLEVAEAELIL
jgi:hypothetical protein